MSPVRTRYVVAVAVVSAVLGWGFGSSEVPSTEYVTLPAATELVAVPEPVVPPACDQALRLAPVVRDSAAAIKKASTDHLLVMEEAVGAVAGQDVIELNELSGRQRALEASTLPASIALGAELYELEELVIRCNRQLGR